MQYKLCKVRSAQFGDKGVPHITTFDGRTIRWVMLYVHEESENELRGLIICLYLLKFVWYPLGIHFNYTCFS